MIETLRTGSAPGVSMPTIAWPGLVVGGAALLLLGEHDPARRAEDDLLQRVREVRRARPSSWPRRAASSAASLARFAMSAPTMPGVIAAMSSRSTSSSSGSERVWTSRILRRPSLSGGGTVTRRSKRPGRSSAASRISARLVAAEHDHRVALLEPVHLGEDLVERLLALVVAAAERAGAGRAAAPDRVELVDEDDRRRGLLGLLEEVAHARGADADDRLDELRRADARRTARPPRPRPRGRAASCPCPAGPRAARRAESGRRAAGTSPGS